MHRFRHLIRVHRRLAALLLACAILVRLLVPAGFMPVAEGRTLTIAMCTGYGPATMTIPLDQDQGGGGHESATDHPCAFAGLGGPALAATDAALLAAALLFAFVFATSANPLPPLSRIGFLRPPLRGPPLHA